ncbi:hypothetical protein V5O48_010660, partial [Marasmius crinis-equi]
MLYSLQSGMLYPITEFTQVIFQWVVDPKANGKGPIALGILVTEVAAIAPTLIIARSGSGKSPGIVEEAISSIQFASIDSTDEIHSAKTDANK